ncbi:MAG: phosphatase PAP2 family protein [Chitinophagaceae bacterium]
MLVLKKAVFICLTGLSAFGANAQRNDLSDQPTGYNDTTTFTKTFESKKDRLWPVVIAPSLMIGYGVASIHSHSLLHLNSEVKYEVYSEHPHMKVGIDTYLQFVPAALVYGLDGLGIHGHHNVRDQSMLYILSNMIANGIVYPVKKYTHELRPDGSSYTSFPSGHTAEAFASATFLWNEYRNVSVWYGVAGYAMAATTGYLRLYNNRHWLSDVIAGAGVGIASTEIAYWLYPKIVKLFTKDKSQKNFLIPQYQDKSVSLAFVHRL